MLNKIRTTLENYIEKTKMLLYSKEFLETSKENQQDFSRNRKLPFPKLIQFMLTRTKGSTQNALEKYFDKLGEDIFITQQAFSEARNKLKASVFSVLFYMTASLAYDGYYDTYRDYRVLAIDGSKITLPDTDLLGRIYGTMGSNSSSPTAQASICYDVLNKVIVDALIEPLTTDERTLALRHVQNLEKSKRFDKELLIMDRGYPSFTFIYELHHNQGLSFLTRVKRGFNKDIDAQTKADSYVVLRKRGYPDLKLRVIKFTLPSGETEILLTNLFQRNLGVKAFMNLYFLRWPVETKYDEVKNKLEIENFTGYSKKAIEQDFYATMYLSNIAAAARWEAQPKVKEVRESKNNKYAYAVNVNHAIGVLKDRFIYALTLDNPSPEVEKIILLLTKRVCPIKPNRSVQRNKSPRKAKFHINSRSNC